MKVPFFSTELVDDKTKQAWVTSFESVISSESFISGSSVGLFESEFAEYVGAKFGVATSNGLDGLVLALRCAKIGKGDKVAVPSHTFIATYFAVLHVGATPLPIDVDQFGLLDLDLLEGTKTKLRAVIPVHMHGSMVDMRRLKNWANKEHVIVIEDSSQAHGCERDGIKAGESGDLSVFSLYPTKNLGALGDAGVVVTSNSDFDTRLRSLRNYGSSPHSKYLHTEIGYNNRLDTVQAAILRINLTQLDDWNAKRRQLAKRYEELLMGLPIRFLVNQEANSVYHHFPILTRKRKELQRHLAENGIGTEIHYPNLASEEIANLTGIKNLDMKQGESIARTTLSLPISQWHSNEQIEYVAQSVLSFFGENQ